MTDSIQNYVSVDTMLELTEQMGRVSVKAGETYEDKELFDRVTVLINMWFENANKDEFLELYEELREHEVMTILTTNLQGK